LSHRIGFCDDDNDVESQISAEDVRVVGIRAFTLRRLAEIRQRVTCNDENVMGGKTSFANPGSGPFFDPLDPGSGMGKMSRSGSGMNNLDHISESF